MWDRLDNQRSLRPHIPEEEEIDGRIPVGSPRFPIYDHLTSLAHIPWLSDPLGRDRRGRGRSHTPSSQLLAHRAEEGQLVVRRMKVLKWVRSGGQPSAGLAWWFK